jgi:hypothetical protein
LTKKKKNYEKLCIFSITILLGLLICFFEPQKVFGELEVVLIPSPDKVDIAEAINANIIAKNNGNQTVKIEAIELTTPWTDLQVLNNPFFLNPNRIYKTSQEIIVPENTKSGIYEVMILLKTNESDISTNAKITVDTLKGISLSGEIPFVIIAIVTPGILTYFIIVYGLTRKFDRGYLEIGLVSIGFGFLTWGILILVSSRSIYSIMLGARSVEDYLLTFIIATLVGLGVVCSVLLARKIFGLIMKNKKLAHFNDQLLVRGYAVNDDPTFTKFTQRNLDIARGIGINYSIKLKIHLKADTTNCTMETVEGLLRSHEPKPPHHVNLRPKYVSKCTFDELKSILCTYDSSPLAAYIKGNKIFRKKVSEEANTKNLRNPKSIFDFIADKFKGANTLDALESLLVKYEFSGYVGQVLKTLELQGVSIKKTYGEFSFINFDQISQVDLISYETPYSLDVSLGLETREIPSIKYFSPAIL